LSPDIGYRWNVSERVAVRFDALLHYVENVSDPLFAFPPPDQTNRGAARSTNVDVRVGLSFMFGSKREAPIPPPPPNVGPAAPPVVRPTPAPPPITRTAPRVNQDSIDAANRARLRETLEQPVYFDYDKSELRGDARSALDAKLPALRANPSVRIRIEGHTDERGSDAYNMALGQQRAARARAYLVANGIDAERIDIVSFGEERPVCTGHEETCWTRNRRDQFVVIVGG
jgi:peptidoglycan-associated lipoprotein